MDAVTPMFFMYWTWIGETLRRIEWLMSSGAEVTGSSSGTSGEGT